jgi:virginiamycin B lyase
VWDAPRGSGPYGIAAAPDGTVYFASLAGNYLGQVDPRTGQVNVLDPPTPAQGARRVWVDSKNRAWISEWNAGKIGMYDPASKTWKEWDVPGAKRAQPYAIYVDAKDGVWITDFANNAIVNYSPGPETFVSYPHPSPGGNVRQLRGRPFGTWREIWGGESGARKLILIRAE